MVYNGDFELYDTCPTNISTPGDLQIERCSGWTAPTKLGTSDYFNLCNTPSGSWGSAGTPRNTVGYQFPNSGNAYAGFISFETTFDVHYREYLQTELIQPLLAGEVYHLSFYVSRAWDGYANSQIGALLSVNDLSSMSYSAIQETPQVVNDSGFLTDTLGWVKVEGDFLSSGGERFLTIGYFEDTLSMVDTINTAPDSVLIAPITYYFVDDVVLYKTNIELELPNVFTPNQDGVNDVFEIRKLSGETYTIYNRWGQIIFDSSVNTSSYWDGRTSTGLYCPEGVYYYIIRLEELDLEYKGTVQLLR